MRQDAGLPAELVAEYVTARAGVSVGGPRQRQLVAAIERAMTAAGITDADRFRTLLERDTDILDELAVAVTVGESYFFRDAAQMELLRREVLPERAVARGPAGTIRLWSAGCAAGQEAYTLAILLEEERPSVHFHVLGTDLSDQALERARRGVYGKWSLRAVDDGRRRTWFRPVPGGFRVDPRLTRFVDFRRHNLLDDAGDQLPAKDLDVVLCRNVLVYLTPAAVEQVARRLVESLAPGGWLLTAATDPRLEEIEGLHTVVTPAGIAYRRLPAASPAASPAVGIRVTRVARTATVTGRQGRSSTPDGARVEGVADALATARELADRDAELMGPAATEPAVPAGQGGNAEAEVELVRALGSASRLDAATEAATRAVARFPVHVELRLLQAIVLLESYRPREAAAAARAALYLDPNLVMAHLALARAEQARGEGAAAQRSYRNALALLESMPEDQAVALADGETVGRLAGLARAGLGVAQQQTTAASRP